MGEESVSTLWTFEGDVTSALDALDEMDSALASMDETLQNLAGAADGLSELDDMFAQLVDMVSGLSEQVGNLEADMSTLAETSDSAAYSLKSIDETLSTMTEDLQSVAEATTSAAESLQELAGAETEVKDGGEGMGLGQAAGLAMIGVAAVGATKSFLDMGLKAQDAFSLVTGMAGTTHDELAALMPGLQQQAMQYGESLDQVASGLYQVESAGYGGKDALLVESDAMKEAQASGAQFSQVASGLTSELHAYHASAQQAGSYTDIMTEAVVRGKQSFQDFVSAIGPLAAAGANVGISFDQISAAEATMTQINPHVRQDATQLTHLLNAVALNADAVSASAHKMGLKFNETTYNSLDLIGKLEYLQTAANGNKSDFEKLVGGSAGLAAALDLLNGKGATYAQNLEAMRHASGATDAAFKEHDATIKAATDHIGAALSVLSYNLVAAITPHIVPIINDISDALGNFADFVSTHFDQVLPIIIGLATAIGVILVGALVAFVGPMLAAAAPFLAVAAAVGVLAGALSGPILGAFHIMSQTSQAESLKTKEQVLANTVAEKEGVVGNLVEMKNEVLRELSETRDKSAHIVLEMKLKHIETQEEQARGAIRAAEQEREGVEAQLEAMDPATRLHAEQRKNADISAALAQKEGVLAQYREQAQRLQIMIGETSSAQVRAALETRLKTVEHAQAQAEGVVSAMKKQQQGVVAQMKEAQAALSAQNSNPIVNMIHGIGSAWQSIQPGLQSAGRMLLQVLGEVGGYLKSVFMPLWGELTDLWKNDLQPAFSQLWDALKQMEPLFLGVAAAIGAIASVAVGLLVGALKGTVDAIESVISGIAQVFTGIVQFVTGLVQVISNILGFFVDLFTGNFSKLGADLHGIWQGIVNMFTGLGHAILGILRATFGAIFSALGGFISGFIGFFKHLFDVLVGHSIIPDLVTGIISWIASLPGKVLGFIAHMVGGILGFLGGLPGKALGFIAQLVSGAATAFNNMLKNIPVIGGLVSRVENMFGGMAHSVGNFFGGMFSQSSQLMQRMKEITQLRALETKDAHLKAVEQQSKAVLTHYQQMALQVEVQMAHAKTATEKHALAMKLVMIENAERMAAESVKKAEAMRSGIETKMAQMKKDLDSQSQSIVSQVLGNLGGMVGGAINVGKNMISGLAGAIKGGVSGVLGGIKDVAGSIGGAIASFLHFSKPDEGPLSSVDEWMPHFGETLSTGLAQIVPEVQIALRRLTDEFQRFDTSVLTRATTTFTSLIAMSRTWGQDLVLGLTRGINAASPQLDHSVQQLAQTVAQYLHFSHPDVGPLSDVETWMPHFGDVLAGGLSQQISKLQTASSGIAQTLAQGALSASARLAASPQGASGAGLNNGQMIALLTDIRNALQQNNRNAPGSIGVTQAINGVSINGVTDPLQFWQLMNAFGGLALENAQRGATKGL